MTNRTVLQFAFEIGYNEAKKHNGLIAPATSDDLQDTIRAHCNEIKDIRYLAGAFNKGQAKWLRENVHSKFCKQD